MATDLRGYTEQEVLNKVLNTSSDSIKVDIVSGSEYAEDSSHTSADTGQFVLGVRNDTLAALGGADGDYVPFQMNASGALYVDIANGGQLDTLLDTLETTLTAIETDADAIETLLTGIDADTDAIKTSLDNIDNAVDGNYLNVNMNLAGSDAQAGEGTISATTQRVTIATDDDGVAHLATIAGAVSTQMQVDVVAISAQSDGTYIGDIKFGESLPAGTNNIGDVDILSIAAGDNNIGNVDIASSLPAGSNAIGKLAANSGVDIGDVDVTSIVPGTGATNLGKAIQSTQGSTDTGVAALAVRNDALADLSGADGDYTPLQVNKTGALNVTENTGYLGAIFEDGTDNITSKKVIAIQFIEDTTFTTLTPVDSSYIGTASGNGDAIDTSNTFPQGMTIFGRWTGFRLASGTIVAYQGDW